MTTRLFSRLAVLRRRQPLFLLRTHHSIEPRIALHPFYGALSQRLFKPQCTSFSCPISRKFNATPSEHKVPYPSPISILYGYYGTKSEGKHTLVFETQEIRNIGFTSEFLCPITNKKFKSGRMRGINYVEASDGRIFYTRKKQADHAAAARALDYIGFTEDEILEPRFCEEHPMDAVDTSAVVGTSAGEGLNGDDDAEENLDDEEEENLDEDGEYSVNTQGQTEGGSDMGFTAAHKELKSLSPDLTFTNDSDFSSLDFDEESNSDMEDGEEDEEEILFAIENDDEFEDELSENSKVRFQNEELVVYDAPRRGSFRTPAQLLLQQFDKKTETTSALLDRGRLVEDPNLTARELIAWAESWVATERKMRDEVSDSHTVVLKRQSEDTLLLRAKSVLTCLAQALERIPLESRTHRSTQKVAHNVLEVLWNSSAAKPDADAYALYLRCLDDKDLKKRAEEAEKIVECMSLGNRIQGFVPPPPDVNVFNELIKLWAQAGKSDFEDILSCFRPNRETYLLLLSSEAYKNGVGNGESPVILNTTFCCECIDKIRELSTDKNDEYELMNAPLRWSGGRRRDGRIIPWSNFGAIFEHGFKDYNEMDAEVQNAKCIQDWIQNNPRLTVDADIVSYEALIQAWVRTGTRKGLCHAEELVKKLLSEPRNSPRYPRFQTFHPILVAWFECKAPDGYSHLRQWTDEIFAIADTSSGMHLDARLFEMAIESRNLLIQQANSEQTTSKESLQSEAEELKRDDVLSKAKECTELLHKFCDSALHSYKAAEGPCFDSLWVPFALTLQVWENAAQTFNCAANSPISSADIFSELTKIRSYYELLASEILSYERASSHPGELKSVSQGIVSNAHHVYIAHMSAMKFLVKIDASKREGFLVPDDSLPSSILIELEACTRKIVEFNELHSLHIAFRNNEDTSLHDSSELLFTDYFDYGLKELFQTDIRRSGSPWVIARLLLATVRGGIPLHMTSNVTRTCHLLTQIGEAWNFRTQKLDDFVQMILDEVSLVMQHHYSNLPSPKKLKILQESSEDPDISVVDSQVSADGHQIEIKAKSHRNTKGKSKRNNGECSREASKGRQRKGAESVAAANAPNQPVSTLDRGKKSTPTAAFSNKSASTAKRRASSKQRKKAVGK